MQSRIQELPIFGFYDKQRFVQFNPSDAANWYITPDEMGKKGFAMYPTMGRRHIQFLGINRLIFGASARLLTKTNNFWYAVVVNSIFRIDQFYNVVEISQGKVTTFGGDIFADFLVVSQLPQQPSITFVGFVDGQHIYIYREETGAFDIITDPNAPANPTYIATFANRFVAAGGNTSQFNLSDINLGGGAYTPATAWTIAGNAVFAQASNIIKGFGVLKNILYIFTPFTTEPWANLESTIPEAGGGTTQFPWKQNASYNFDYGLEDQKTLDIGFNRMCWYGKNKAGLRNILLSSGEAPTPISTDAIAVLIQDLTSDGKPSPFITGPFDGFLYSFENTIFYRLNVGTYDDTKLIDLEDLGNSIEYNFNTKSWHRCIEKNGQRNRIQKHVFFNNTHLVSLVDEGTIYQMSGRFYDNERRNPAQPDAQAEDAYLVEPFKYIADTRIIFEKESYAEFETEYVEIDFVWGFKTFIRSTNPFPNAEFLVSENSDPADPTFIIDEELGPDGQPIYILGEQGNFPVADSLTYNNWFKPHVELYFSDDGGVGFEPADVREFSQLGVYQWRMRWYQLGPSRNRVYRLVAYSPSPIVVLGGVQLIRRISGGAN